jgi:hypothetical protein
MPAFRGPGQRRSQAERPEGDVFAMLADMTRRLADLGQPEAEALVRKAEQQAQAGDSAAASATLLEAAASLSLPSPPYIMESAEVDLVKLYAIPRPARIVFELPEDSASD